MNWSKVLLDSKPPCPRCQPISEISPPTLFKEKIKLAHPLLPLSEIIWGYIKIHEIKDSCDEESKHMGISNTSIKQEK